MNLPSRCYCSNNVDQDAMMARAVLYPGFYEATSEPIEVRGGERIRVYYDSDTDAPILFSIYAGQQSVEGRIPVYRKGEYEIEVLHTGWYFVKVQCLQGKECSSFVRVVRLPAKEEQRTSLVYLQEGEKISSLSPPLRVTGRYPVSVEVGNTGDEPIHWRVFRIKGQKYEIADFGVAEANKISFKDVIGLEPGEYGVSLVCTGVNCSGMAAITSS